jgi:hypothetical protein
LTEICFGVTKEMCDVSGIRAAGLPRYVARDIAEEFYKGRRE